MKKIVILLSIVAAILGVGIVVLLFSKGIIVTDTTTPPPLIETGLGSEQKPIDQNIKDTRIKVDGVTLGDIKAGEIMVSNFKFEPQEIAVKKGDTVTIKVTNTQGIHDFTIDEFNVKTKALKEGESEEVTFTVDKTGTFEFYCSIGQHKAMGMVGSITVE